MDDIKPVVIAVLLTIIVMYTLMKIAMVDVFVRVNGTIDTGLYVDFKGTVYKLTAPQTAENCGSEKTATNTSKVATVKE